MHTFLLGWLASASIFAAPPTPTRDQGAGPSTPRKWAAVTAPNAPRAPTKAGVRQLRAEAPPDLDGHNEGIPGLLARVRRTYAKRSYTAHFTQTYVDEVSGPRASESGTLTVSAGGQVRFAYAGAEAKLFVFDGNDAWFAEPDAAQATRFAEFADGPAGEALAFLWGGGAQLRDFIAEPCQKDCPTLADGERVVSFRPRQPMAAVSRVDLRVADRTGEVVAVRVRDSLGNETRYALDARRFDVATTPDTFRYAPPEGFSVVQALAQ